MTNKYQNALELYENLKKMYPEFCYERTRGMWCYCFIRKYIKQPYPPLEPLILASKEAIFFYARWVVRGRYIKGEKRLFATKCAFSQWRCYYTSNILWDEDLKENIYNE